ncbi:VOC family protein [Porticoccaceae bacterium LTM1]|nr:VOC family protein [Porticoccaceae bacterium LTM1]
MVKSICGVILSSADPAALAKFYSAIMDISFEPEKHGNLHVHFGADIGEVHFGIHPPENLAKSATGYSTTTIAFNVASLDMVIEKLKALGAKEVIAPHNEGFGLTTTYMDPEGNHLELVELDYNFDR